MKIQKTYQSAVRDGKILNSKSDNQNDTYSCDYINQLYGTVLYDGIALTSTIPLSDNISNYEYIDITFGNSRQWFPVQRFKVQNGNNITITAMEMLYTGAIYFNHYFAAYHMNGNELTYTGYGGYEQTTYNTSGQSTAFVCSIVENNLYIKKIVGYKQEI